MNVTYVFTSVASPVGELTLVGSERGLAAIVWEDDRPGRVRARSHERDDAHPILVEAARQLAQYFAGTRTTFELPLDFVGTDFQRAVWHELLAIPYGETRTYGEIAMKLGNPKAVRAVGAANGRNPLSIVAPCHRVIGASGKLTGFAGGLEAKALLLDLERRGSMFDFGLAGRRATVNRCRSKIELHRPEIVSIAGRGTMMGNRGILHDEHKRIVRRSAVRRWITCVLSFKDRKLEVMAARRYTQLFFLDEATAFAAGHRPCAECRRDDFRMFRALWTARFGRVATIDAVDDVLHAERLDGKAKRTWRGAVDRLPDGTYVTIDGIPRVVRGDALVAWSGTGYTSAIRRPATGDAVVLTPRAIVALFADGYEPAFHPSLDAATG